jgi:hypothetical protein
MYRGFHLLHEIEWMNRLDEKIVHLFANCLERTVESRISRKNESYGIRLSTTECADDCEPIARLSNIQVGNEYIEPLPADG